MPPLARFFWSAPFVIAAGCAVDEQRDLSYGVGVSSGSASSLTEAAGEGGGGSAGSGDAGDRAIKVGETPDNSRPGTASGGSGSGSANVSGSANAGNTSLGGSATNGGGSSGGFAGSGGMVDDGPCGDIDQNGVQDCQETLVTNATFDANADAWVADFGVNKLWQATDARGKVSGSVSLTFATSNGGAGWVLAAIGQCLPAWSEQEFEVGGRSFIPAAQSGGRAEISLATFGEDGCQGSFLQSVVPALSAQAGSWQPLHGSAKMPAGTRSVLVRLAAAKPGSQASLEAQFDDILFRKK
jgi:hypothetical protein